MTPIPAIRQALGPSYRMKSDREIVHIVVSVLGAVREPSVKVAANGQWAQLDTVNPPVTLCVEANIRAKRVFRAMIDALIEEVTAEAGR